MLLRSQLDDELVFRPYEAGDIPFIYRSWGSSSYKGSGAYRDMPPGDFHALHRPQIDLFFTKPKATIIVATHKSDPDVIMGWIGLELLEENTVIHYCYVKALFRRQQIASKLIDRIVDKLKPVIITHMSFKVRDIMQKNHDKYIRFVYLP